MSRLVKVTQFAITLKTSVARSKEKITMTAYSYIHGDPDIMDEQYNKIVMAHAQFFGILAQIRYNLEMPPQLE